MVAQILSPAQRAALFDPPSDPAEIERLYTLGPDDLVEVFRRRRAANRIGYAVQLGYLHHPGRALEPGSTAYGDARGAGRANRLRSRRLRRLCRTRHDVA
nr:DUF4158 domain-containing protein [uncultured Novosphingobium sp.]